jgi:hypothetical protein
MEDKLNQHIRQVLELASARRITIELEEIFGNKSNENFISMKKEQLIHMEYAEGMLILDYYLRPAVEAENIPAHQRCTQMISKERVKRIYFDDAFAPERIPFPNHQEPVID